MTQTIPEYDPVADGWEPVGEIGFSPTIGPFLRKADGARVLWAIQTDARHRNNNGGVHGGLIASLADHALGNVARASVDGRATATIQMDVQFVAAGQLGDFLVAQSSVVRTTRSIVFMQGEIHAGDRLIATASGLWKVLGA